MRHAAIPLVLAAALTAPAANAQTRILSQINGWTAFDGTSPRGAALCGMETRDPNTGRHFLLLQEAGQGMPVLRLSRPNWNLGPPSSRTVRIVIDRRVFAANATGAGQELSWPAALDSFEPAFRLGRVMRVEFPAGPDAPWNLSLTGTNAVMGAFMGCLRMLSIQPGVTPPAEPQPIQPPPAAEPPPLAPSPLAPPPSGPTPLGPAPEEPPSPAPAPPDQAPRFGAPSDKPVPTVPDGKAPGGKPRAPTPL